MANRENQLVGMTWGIDLGLSLENWRAQVHMNASTAKNVMNSCLCYRQCWGFPAGSSGKESPANAGEPWKTRLDPQIGKILWRRKMQPTPVFLPGQSHGQRSLVGYSSRGHKESDTTERLITPPLEEQVGVMSQEDFHACMLQTAYL